MHCSIKKCFYNKYHPKYSKSNPETTYHYFPHPEKEIDRYNSWLRAIDIPELLTKDRMIVFRQSRICRRHFDKDCFNGGVKRLIKTAVPSLYLSSSNQVQEDNRIISNDITLGKRKHSKTDMDDENAEVIDAEDDGKVIIMSIELDKNDDSLITQRKKKLRAKVENEYIRLLNELDIADFSKVPLTEENFAKWKREFYENDRNVLAQNVCSRADPMDICLSRKSLENTNHVFAHKVEIEGKPLTNQKSSGRCWIFAALNVIRIPFMKQYNLDEFEFSQGYLFYWDKIERCHYFLNNIVETALRGEEVNSRLVSFLLSDPTCDGGQWDMIVNLIKKHGLMPKKCFPETYSCEASVRMNAILKSKLREYAKILRDLVGSGSDEGTVKAKIDEQMREIYNVVGICLSIPNDVFTWEYYDKSKNYHSVGPITAVDFYEQLVKPYFNLDNKVCLVTDPRPSNPYGQAYTVDCLGNVVGGRPVLYNNQPVELLAELVGKSIQSGEPVWFGCEVSKRFAGKQGIEDLLVYEKHDFNLVFGVDIQVTMSKADRLLYGESAMTHAMSFTAVTCNDSEVPTKFRVENSWGDERGEKGYLVMSYDWFKEFVFEVVVDKSIVPKEVLDVFNMTPIVLPAWDPMGTLAK